MTVLQIRGDQVIDSEIDHGSIGGLTDDDHARYIDKDGTRELTGDWDIGSGKQIQADIIRSRKQGGIRLGGYDVDYTDIDFTSPAWTEEDPGDDIVVSGTKVAWTALPKNVDSRVFYDYGAAYFDGDFRYELEAKQTAGDNTGYAYIWMVANDLDDAKGLIDGSKDYLAVFMYDADGTPRFYLQECDGGATTSDNVDVAEGTLYYLTIVRDESVGTHGTIYCYIYTDADRTILFHKLELPLNSSKKDFRYLYSCNSYNNAGAPTHTGFMQNLTISTDIFGLEKGIYVHDDGTVDMRMQSGCSVYLSGAQSLLAGDEDVLEFDLEFWDTQNEFNVANHRFTATQPGVYSVKVQALFQVTAAGDRCYVKIRKNGSAVKEFEIRSSYTSNTPVSVVGDVWLDIGDYLGGWAENANNNDTISAVTRSTHMTVSKIA